MVNFTRLKIALKCFAALFLALLTGSFISAAAQTVHNVGTSSLVINPGSGDWVLTGTTTTNRVEIMKDYKGTVTFRGLNMTASGAFAPVAVYGEYNCPALSPVTIVDIVLEGANYLTQTAAPNAAFQVDQGAQIQIRAVNPQDNSSGSLFAHSTGGAGIGTFHSANQGTPTIIGTGCPTAPSAGGNIIISSGTISAKGGHSAGIGGGWWNWYDGIIFIYGGDVTATAASHAAGIGSGCPSGSGVITTCAPSQSAIIVLPPAKISATSAPATLSGIAGANSITYIGDPTKPLIDVYTETYEPFASIYADLTMMSSVTTIATALGLNTVISLNNMFFGMTDATGHYKINGQLDQPVTFFTDAYSTQPATWGRPFKPVQMTTTSATNNVMLPMLEALIGFEVTPATPMPVGYSTADALTNAYMLKITYTDPNPITGLTFSLANGGGTDFKDPVYYGSDGTTVIAKPTSFNSGDVYYIKVPIKDGYPLGIYTDVLRFEGLYKGLPTGIIRQVVEQRIVIDDTGPNSYIKVTASPPSFVTNSPATASANLSLLITHGSLTVLYDQKDVTAKYLISTLPKYADALAAVPLSHPDWKPLTTHVNDGGPAIPTTASFTGLTDGTYYIHWYATSGIVYAHSEDFVDPADTYGAFGPYIIDQVGPSIVSIIVDGEAATKIISSTGAIPVEVTFDEPINTSSFAVSDFSFPSPIGPVGTISLIALKTGNDRVYTASLKPDNSMANDNEFTIQIPVGAVTDIAGNPSTAASNAVRVVLDATTKPVVDFPGIKTVYTSLRPSFTAEVDPSDYTINSNEDVFPSATGSAITVGQDLASFFTITPTSGTPLPTTSYTAKYTKSGTGASARGVITFDFTADLANSTTYTVSLAADKVFNLLRNGNDAKSVSFTTAIPTFPTGDGAGLFAEPNLFDATGGTTSLIIKGENLKINTETNGLMLRVESTDLGYDSGPITSGFTNIGQLDSLKITGVNIPANTTPATVTYEFELYWTQSSASETSTGMKAIVTVEPDAGYIVKVENLTPSVVPLIYGYTDSERQAQAQRIKVTNMGAVPLENFVISFTGTHAAAFSVYQAWSITSLAAGDDEEFTVYLNTGQVVDIYNANVKVEATQQLKPTPVLNGSVPLLPQEVTKAAGTGVEGIVTGVPEPSASWVNISDIALTPKATTTGDEVVNWEYAVTTSPSTPASSDPAWTAVLSSSPAMYPVAPLTEGTYYIHYVINTKLFTNIAGIVQNSAKTANMYNIDRIVPEVVTITPERLVTNASPFKVTFEFSEAVTGATTSMFTATNAYLTDVVSIGSDMFEAKVEPFTGLTNGTPITITVGAGAVKDRAVNLNPPALTSKTQTVIFDGSHPNPTLTTPKLKVNAPFIVTVTFDSEIVTPFDTDPETDFFITNGAMTPTTFTGAVPGRVFTFEVVPNSSLTVGDIVIELPVDQVFNSGGNGNTMGRLTVKYSVEPVKAVLTYSGPVYANGAFDIGVSFSQDITGLQASDFSFEPDLTPSLKQLTPRTYTLTLTPSAGFDKSTDVELKKPTATALDEYGNLVDGGSNIVKVNYDTKPPVVEYIAMENASAEVNFDPFNVVIRFNEPNITTPLDISKLESDILDILSVVSGPVTVGAGTEYVVRVQIPFDTAVTGATLGMKVNAGAVKDKATNPNAPTGVINLTNWTTSGGGGGTRGPSGPPVIFVDNVNPFVVSMSPSGDWAPVVGNLIITFNKRIDQTAPGTIWLEDFGYLDLSKATWVNPRSISLPYGYLTYNSTYRVHVAGFRDLSKNMQDPEFWGVFSTAAPVRPTMQREIILFAGQGLELSVDPSKIHYVMIGSDFVFNVKAGTGYNLDKLQVVSGIDHRDNGQGIVIEKNADGSATVTVKYVTEPILYLTVTLGTAQANETPEATKIWAAGENLYIRALQPATINVYTMSGILFRQITVSEGLTTEQLPRGIYTVLMEGKAYKVSIK
jgi:hypothetical protein